jgi:hypothetical protein
MFRLKIKPPLESTSLYQDFIFSKAIAYSFRLRGPLLIVAKCNRLLSLPRWYECWYVWPWSAKRDLKPKFYRLPRPWSLWGSSPTRESSHGRTRNWTRDLMVSRSAEHQATRLYSRKNVQSHIHTYIYIYIYTSEEAGGEYSITSRRVIPTVQGNPFTCLI